MLMLFVETDLHESFLSLVATVSIAFRFFPLR